MTDVTQALAPKAIPAERVLLAPASNRFLSFWRVFRKNKLAVVGLGVVLFFLAVAILGPWLAPYDPIDQELRAQLQGPSREHPFGTDEFGRDIFSRVIVGARPSLMVGVIATAIGATIGTLVGLLAGYFSRLDTPFMRLMDVLLAFPSILLAIAIIAVLGPSLFNVMIAVGIRSVPSYARLVRSTVLSAKESDYVQAARSIGSGEGRILFRHVFPNSLSTIIVLSSLQIGEATLASSILSFLGLGIQPPDPEWGQMVSAGRGFLSDAPHITTFPGLALFLVVMGFNLAGDGIRDALDPRLKNV